MSSCRVHGAALALSLAGCVVQVVPARENARAPAPPAPTARRASQPAPTPLAAAPVPPSPAAAPAPVRAGGRPAPASERAATAGAAAPSSARAARADIGAAPAAAGGELALSPNVLRRRRSAESVNGSLPRGVVQAVVRERNPVISRCYEEGLQRNPGLSGKLAVRFVISRDGSVSEANLAESSLSDREVNRCIVSQFSTMRFPQPADGAMTVIYPVQFAPAAPSAPVAGSTEKPKKR